MLKMPGLLLLLILVAGGCTFLEKEGYVEIEDIQVQVSEERPASVWVDITIGREHPSCSKLLPPQQDRKGNTIYITFRALNRPTGACLLVLMHVEVTVLLKGRFAPGVYRVIVSSKANSLEQEFEVTP